MVARLLALGPRCHLNHVGSLRPTYRLSSNRRLARHVVVNSQNASDTTNMISEAEKFMESMIEESPTTSSAQQSPASLLSEREAILKQASLCTLNGILPLTLALNYLFLNYRFFLYTGGKTSRRD